MKKNIAAGFYRYDDDGVYRFHPLRSSFDYDRARVGEPRGRKKNIIGGLDGLSDLVFLTQTVGGKKKRKSNPGWIRSKAVRVRKSGGQVLLDILR